jgi:hypothetical protein
MSTLLRGIPIVFGVSALIYHTYLITCKILNPYKDEYKYECKTDIRIRKEEDGYHHLEYENGYLITETVYRTGIKSEIKYKINYDKDENKVQLISYQNSATIETSNYYPNGNISMRYDELGYVIYHQNGNIKQEHKYLDFYKEYFDKKESKREESNLKIHINLNPTKYLIWKNNNGISLIPPEKGIEFIAYKACRINKTTNVYVEMLVFSDSDRLFTCNKTFIYPKIRFNKCKVLSITDKQENKYDECESFCYVKQLIYKVDEIVESDSFDSDPNNECSNGIHGFMTREECENMFL